MTNKNYGWHHKWRRAGNRLQHESGLQFEYVNDAWQFCPETFETFAAAESARGVPSWQLETRIITLTKEAERWDANPRNRKNEN